MLFARLTPIALTLMRTSPAAGCGSETSLNLRNSGAPKDANSTIRDMTGSLLVWNAASKGWGPQAHSVCITPSRRGRRVDDEFQEPPGSGDVPESSTERAFCHRR